MLRATDDERDAIIAYYQSPDRTEVRFLQKVYSEAVLGHRHDVWDVHASDGRWWVITNPTNLYSQDQFPNMDLAVTFHMGLCLRIPKSQKGSFSRRQVAPIGDVIQQIHDIDEALSQALRLADYQGIGVRCREALLAFVAAAQDVMEWTDQAELPKRADFRAWNDLIWNRVLSGGDQAERRRLVF